jgi:hypothetical protein
VFAGAQYCPAGHEARLEHWLTAEVTLGKSHLFVSALQTKPSPIKQSPLPFAGLQGSPFCAKWPGGVHESVGSIQMFETHRKFGKQKSVMQLPRTPTERRTQTLDAEHTSELSPQTLQVPPTGQVFGKLDQDSF